MAHRNQAATRLALLLIEEQYGQLCQITVNSLLEKGMQTFAELLRTTELTASKLKQTLLVLMQHNCVSAYLQPQEASWRGQTPAYHMYEADVSRILHFLRVPRILLQVREEHGDLGETMVTVMFQHGRLRHDQLVASVMSQLRKTDTDSKQEIQTKFLHLVQCRYLERAPPCELPPPVPKAAFSSRRPNAKKDPIDKSVDLAKLATANYEKERFRIPTSLHQVWLENTNSTENSGGVNQLDGARVGSKRARDGQPQENGVDDLSELSSAVLWRVNCDEFDRRFRHLAVTKLMREKLGPQFAAVFSAILYASRSFETKVQQERSQAVSVSDIQQACRFLCAEVQQQLPGDVEQCLSDMAQDGDWVTQTGEGPGGSLYCVHLAGMMSIIQFRLLEGMMRSRYGPNGLRVFKVLLLQRQLEQKQVSDYALITKEETRGLLYHMLQDGYISLQDIPKTADHAPSRTVYTWRASYPLAKSRLAADLYKAAFNLKERLAYELQQEAKVLDLFSAENAPASLYKSYGAQLERIRQVSALLEASLLKLDSEIAVFNDF